MASFSFSAVKTHQENVSISRYSDLQGRHSIVGDFDGDGRADLITSNGYFLYFQKGLGKMRFSETRHTLFDADTVLDERNDAGAKINILEARDIDANGTLDLSLQVYGFQIRPASNRGGENQGVKIEVQLMNRRGQQRKTPSQPAS